MGNTTESRKDFKSEHTATLVGFENKSNTVCYANSVLQVLFHHPVFIDIITKTQCTSHGLISQLKTVFKMMEGKKEKTSVSTLKLMSYIEKESNIFDRDHHQDCHEFYIWLMNSINDQLKAINKKSGINGPTKLQGEFFSNRVSRTQCLKCKTVSEREQEEVDLSLVLPEPNVSLNYCIENYSAVEKLSGRDKFKCDKCGDLQNAQKRTLVKTLPNILSIHLRRFKYDESRKGITKLTWLIPFPYSIKMKSNYGSPNQEKTDIAQVHQNMYRLVGVVAHLGTGGNYGHYMSYLKIGRQWYQFNDDEISEVDDYAIQSLWGYKGVTRCAYMLFYTL